MMDDDLKDVQFSRDVLKLMKPVCRAYGLYDADLLSLATAVGFFEKSLTQQHFKDECDINEIVRRFGLTGKLPENVKAPQYGDFTGLSDYQTALNAVIAADEAFMELPA